MKKAGRSVQNTKRIQWIDGLKGFGCLCIFFHHFLLSYYPATYWGAAAESKIRWGLDTRLADLPFFFLINGNFWVCVYLFLSGLVIVNKKLDKAYENRLSYFLKSFLKRYLTLVLPIFLVEMMMFLGNLLFPVEVVPSIGEPLSFIQYLKSTFWSVLFTCDRDVLGSLWTMQAIFLGGLLVLGIRLAFRKQVLQAVILTLCGIAFLYSGDFWYFSPVMAGGLFWILYPALKKIPGQRVLGILVFVAGVFLAAYPSGLVSEGVYGLLPGTHFGPFLYHYLGTILFIWGIGNLVSLQGIFTYRIGTWLGKISYPFYVFHGFFLKLTKILFTALNTRITSYSVVVILTGAAALLLCLTASFIYAEWMEPVWRKTISKIS